MNFPDRLEQLERTLVQTNEVVEYRVAGKTRSEINAEFLALLFVGLEAIRRGAASDIARAAKTWVDRPIEPGDPDECVLSLVRGVWSSDQDNPGLSDRVLSAVLQRRRALIEGDLFPNGRPESEQGYYSRQGKKFFLPMPRPSTLPPRRVRVRAARKRSSPQAQGRAKVEDQPD